MNASVECCVHPGIWLPRPWVPERLDEVARRAQEAGYTKVVVPLHDLSEIEPSTIAEVFAKHGLQAVNSIGQTPEADVSSDDPGIRDRGVERLRRAASFAQEMGSHHLGGVIYSSLGHADRAVSEDRFTRTAVVVGRLAEELAELDVQLVCEIVNRYETALLNTAAQGARFIDIAGSENLKLHLDAFHMNIEEEDMLAAIDTAMPYLAYLELSQNSRNGVSDGSTDLSGLVAHAWRVGFRGTYGVEAFSAGVLTDGGRLAVWRDVFGPNNRIAEEARCLIARSIEAVA